MEEFLVVVLCNVSRGVELRGSSLGKDLIPAGELIELVWIVRVCCEKPVDEGVK